MVLSSVQLLDRVPPRGPRLLMPESRFLTNQSCHPFYTGIYVLTMEGEGSIADGLNAKYPLLLIAFPLVGSVSSRDAMAEFGESPVEVGVPVTN